MRYGSGSLFGWVDFESPPVTWEHRPLPAPAPWECPKCGAVFAGWVASCTYCKPKIDSEREG